MPDASTTTGTPAPGATVATPAPEAAAPALTLEAIEALFDAKLSTYTTRLNRDLADVRKIAKGERGHKGTAPSGDAPAEQPPAASLTLEDLRASREVGRLEAQIGDEIITSLGDDYASMTPGEQARILRVLVAAKPQTAGEGDGSRGKTPARTLQTSRAEPPAPRDSVPRPATRREFQAMTAPQRKTLIADPNFDPMTLPY